MFILSILRGFLRGDDWGLGRGSFSLEFQTVGLPFQSHLLCGSLRSSFRIFVVCLFYCLLRERLFWCFRGTAWLLQYYKDTFHFNLTWKDSFLESSFREWIFDRYIVLHQLFTKHQLSIGNLGKFQKHSLADVLQKKCS